MATVSNISERLGILFHHGKPISVKNSSEIPKTAVSEICRLSEMSKLKELPEDLFDSKPVLTDALEREIMEGLTSH